jgi:hypothetical protein
MITVVIADHKKSGRAACRQVLQLEKGMEGVGEAWVPRKMVAKIIDRLARLTAGQEGG